jgi:hypothetical protein
MTMGYFIRSGSCSPMESGKARGPTGLHHSKIFKKLTLFIDNVSFTNYT